MSEIEVTATSAEVAGEEKRNTTLSHDIQAVFADGKATIGELLSRTDQKSFGFFLVLFGMPTAIPAPPGFATPFGIVLMVLAIQILKGQSGPTLPQKLLTREIGGATGKFLMRLSKILAFFEKLLRPRMGWLYNQKLFRYWIAPTMVLAAFCVILPLPATNSVPAIGMAIVGLGMLEEDGMFALMGWITMLVGIGIALVPMTAILVWGAGKVGFTLPWAAGMLGVI
ncbi:MAG: exopolysaccharide biosynthesis protein [Armatimonadetes bacterium]|nr:exopolysaccharide biosynthesis protein [Armatimonadota bacterium]